jgi:hypothetical protein
MFLSIGGVEYDVTAMSEKPELGGGESVRSYLGALRSTYSWQRRTWEVQLRELTEADYVTLYNATVLGAHLAIDEDAVSGGPLTVEVTILGAPYVRAKDGFRRLVTLALRQV